MSSRQTSGVWISANSATILRWGVGFTLRQRIDSKVPGRHRSTGRPPTAEHPSSFAAARIRPSQARTSWVIASPLDGTRVSRISPSARPSDPQIRTIGRFGHGPGRVGS
jgi:hypothetical protein